MNVLHVFRSPVGGLFRHVSDLVEDQAKRGYKVGIVCDATSGGENAIHKLKALEAQCELGVHRLPMSRSIGLEDFVVQRSLPAICGPLQPDIIHGHGAKGGAYGRFLANKLQAKAVYTPHGGSLHYSIASPTGAIYLALESFFKKLTHGIIFESQFSADTYQKKIGAFTCAHKVIHNGLRETEFAELDRVKGINQFVFIGEIRHLKGLDALLKAMAILTKKTQANLLVFGSGPDEAFYKKRSSELGLDEVVAFHPAIFPATEAFKLAKCVVIPSLAESFPYIVLEAAAAKVPLLTTRVGGIPEIFGSFSNHLLPAGNAELLANAMLRIIETPEQTEQFAQQLHDQIHANFTYTQMVDKTASFYQELLS